MSSKFVCVTVFCFPTNSGHGRDDRSYMNSYQSAIVNIAPSCTIFELLDIETYHDLENWIRGYSKSLETTIIDRL